MSGSPVTPPGPAGSLARALREATTDLHVVQRQVDALLESVVPQWRPRFPAEVGWQFTPPDAIDVYDAAPSATAADALHRAGFRVVVLHGHRRSRAGSCRCKPWRSP